MILDAIRAGVGLGLGPRLLNPQPDALAAPNPLQSRPWCISVACISCVWPLECSSEHVSDLVWHMINNEVAKRTDLTGTESSQYDHILCFVLSMTSVNASANLLGPFSVFLPTDRQIDRQTDRHKSIA